MSKQIAVELVDAEELLTRKYDDVVTEALRANDPQKVLDLKWGRLFLTQTYGYWVG